MYTLELFDLNGNPKTPDHDTDGLWQIERLLLDKPMLLIKELNNNGFSDTSRFKVTSPVSCYTEHLESFVVVTYNTIYILQNT